MSIKVDRQAMVSSYLVAFAPCYPAIAFATGCTLTYSVDYITVRISQEVQVIIRSMLIEPGRYGAETTARAA